MVKERNKTVDSAVFTAQYLNMLDRMGSSFTYYEKTEEVDALGNVIDIDNGSKTIVGDFQIIEDAFFIQQLGFAGKGVAKFYGRASDNLNSEGRIQQSNGDVWVLRKNVEDDQWSGVSVSSVWIAIRLDG